MKIADVEIGGRYGAIVSGKSTIVRVTDIQKVPGYGFGDRQYRATTRIYAVNERTGKQVKFRSAQRLSPLREKDKWTQPSPSPTTPTESTSRPSAS
jgi:hypothetical protein